jgi:hypothetical protein
MQDAVREIKVALVIMTTPYLGCWWAGAAIPHGMIESSLATGRSIQMSGPLVGLPRVAAWHRQSQ